MLFDHFAFSRRTNVMRTILVILAVMLFTGWILSEIEIHSVEGAVSNETVLTGQADSSGWRHTTDGWEKVQDWKPVTAPSVDLHPGIVGLFLLLVSIFSLIGFEVPSMQKC